MSSAIKILKANGTTRHSTIAVQGSEYVKELMTSEYVLVKFNAAELVGISYGDYIMYDGRKYIVIEPTLPKRGQKGGYAYEQKFVAEWMEWANRKVFFDRRNCAEAGWSMTHFISYFLDLIVETIEAEGMGKYSWSLTDETDSRFAEMKLCDFKQSANIIDVLKTLCDDTHWQTEWWVEGKEIKIGLCNRNTSQTIADADIKELSVNQSQNANKANRLYVFGSTKNLTPYYRKELVFAHTGLSEENLAKFRQEYVDFHGEDDFDERVGYIYDRDRILTRDKFRTEAFASMYYGTQEFYPEVLINPSKQPITEKTVFEWSDKVHKEGFFPVISDGNTYEIGYRPRVGFLETDWTTSKEDFEDFEYKVTLDFILRRPDSNGDFISYEVKRIVTVSTQNAAIETSGRERRLTWHADTLFGKEIMKYITKPADEVKAVITIEPVKAPNTIAVYGGFRLNFNNNDMAPIQTHFVYEGRTIQCQTLVGYNGTKVFLDKVLTYDKLVLGYQIPTGDRYKVNNLKSECFNSGLYTIQGNEDKSVLLGIADNRLKLPLEATTDTPYMDLYENMPRQQIKEGIVVLDDIYPKQDCVITAVETYDAKDVNEETGEVSYWRAFRIRYEGFIFLSKYLIPGEKLNIVFQTGNLAGMTFEVKFNPNGVAPETLNDAQIIEIVRTSNYGQLLPNEEYHPEVGDTFNLYGYSIAAVDDNFVKTAEQRLLEAAQEVKQSIIDSVDTYEVTMNPIKAQEGTYDIGQRIRLATKIYGNVDSRIRKVQRSLDDRTLKYTIGQSPSYSRYRELKNALAQIK